MKQPVVVDYMVIVKRDNVSFEKEIRDKLLGGWQPFGGASVSVTESESISESDSFYYVLYVQAMVKYG